MKQASFRFFPFSTLLYNSFTTVSMPNLRILYTENNFKINMCVLLVALSEQKCVNRKKLGKKWLDPLWLLHITVINFKWYGYKRFMDFKLVTIGPSWKSNCYHKSQSWLRMHLSAIECFSGLSKWTSEIHEAFPKPEYLPENGWFLSREFLE